MSVVEVKLEDKKSRSSKEVEAEYNQTAFKAGHLQYEVASKTKDLELLNKQMRDLAFEYTKVAAQEQAADAAAKLEAAKAAETTNANS